MADTRDEAWGGGKRLNCDIRGRVRDDLAGSKSDLTGQERKATGGTGGNGVRV